MKEGIPFKSYLSDEMEKYLRHQKTVDITIRYYEKKIYYMHDFDDYLTVNDIATDDQINENLIASWLNEHDVLAEKSIELYVLVIRQFLEFYRNETRKRIYIPSIPKVNDSYVPYLFSDEEMDRIYAYIDNFEINWSISKLKYFSLEFPLIIRLLDSSGFRISELVNRTMKDVSLEYGVLHLKQTKYNRERLVPLSTEMSEMLRQYCHVMNLAEGTDLPLFPRQDYENFLLWYDVSSYFRKALKALSIYNIGNYVNTRGPCIHCLRHRFVLRSLQKLMSDNVTFEDAADLLVTYLGHSTFKETEMYMKFGADLFPNELEKFEKVAASLYSDEDVWDTLYGKED